MDMFERTRKIIGVNDTVVVLLFLFKYDSKLLSLVSLTLKIPTLYGPLLLSYIILTIFPDIKFPIKI